MLTKGTNQMLQLI